MILAGAILLNLPIASKNGMSIGFVDALFTSTSAVCVTGLVVVDTGTYWSTFGQIVILTLIQIGGLGFMTMATLLSLLIGRRIGLRERLLIQESLNQNSLQGIVKFTKHIIITVFVIELVGALILAIQFVPEFGFNKGAYLSIFHSISAFNNAGFDLMGEYNGQFSSLTGYVDNALVSFTIAGLVILGGLGFFVYKDLFNTKSIKKLSLHSKVVFLMTVMLILFGTIFFFITEYNNPKTMGNLSLEGKIISSIFQSVTPRTAGFNTLPLPDMTNASKFMTVILMFIGGSPGSTAGGIKTVTLGVLMFAVISTIRGKDHIEIFKRKLQQSVVNKSLAIIMISLALVTTVTMILSLLENTSFINVLYETASAFGTVGLSLGITPYLSVPSKIIIALTMFFGRVGPLSIALALSASAARHRSLINYPEDRVMVG